MLSCLYYTRLVPNYMLLSHRTLSNVYLSIGTFTCTMTASSLQVDIASFPFPFFIYLLFSAPIMCFFFISIGLDLCLFCLLTGSSFFSQLSPILLICQSMLFSLSQSIIRILALFSSTEIFSECVPRCETWPYWRRRSYGLIWGWQRMD